ncbi:MAG: cytochrome C oxidase subunit IV family protein [Bacteroidales bacterium]|nr:cytochrome C oxidase subunit IV family protein [Bacteroidales bacterium]
MEHTSTHITSYRTYGIILVILLFLTSITITVTWFDAGRFSVGVAMFIACIKASLVLLYFMHLKFDQLIFKVFAGMVILLLAIVFVITFFDYLFR